GNGETGSLGQVTGGIQVGPSPGDQGAGVGSASIEIFPKVDGLGIFVGEEAELKQGGRLLGSFTESIDRLGLADSRTKLHATILEVLRLGEGEPEQAAYAQFDREPIIVGA